MPKKANQLSALAVSKLKAEGRYAVGGADGLHLRVMGASRTWVLRLVVGSRKDGACNVSVHRRDIGLGSYPEVSLGEARDRAIDMRKQVRGGVDPVKERKELKLRARLEAERTKTFEECALAYIQANKSAWKNEKHTQQWLNTLTTYAFPILGKLPLSVIDTGLVLSVLQQEVSKGDEKAQLWYAKTETASRVRGRIESVMDYATFRGYRTGENPARWKGHLQHELPPRGKVRKVQHHAALPYAHMGAFMAGLRQREGIAARALEFAILTAGRSGEVRGAKWPEIDFKGRLWVIPAERMKMGREHRVPLTERAIKLLEAMPRLENSDYIFPATNGKPLSDMALTAVLRRMERGDLTVHGFRSTFRDWAGETTAYPREVCEHALAHNLAKGVEAAYQRGDLLVKRTRLMADWTKYCGVVQGDTSNVVAIQKEVA